MDVSVRTLLGKSVDAEFRPQATVRCMPTNATFDSFILVFTGHRIGGAGTVGGNA